MAVKIYNKLVRDKIPEIIEADGKTCKTEILSDEEYLKMLDAKLDEELAEYHKDQNIEELADLMEVIYAAAEARGYSVDELEKVRVKKVEERGGFGEKVLLREVESEDNVLISRRSLKELIKTKIKELIIQYKDKIYKIYYCANSATLIMGILITFIGMYSPICGDEPNEVRTTIGAICITIWFLMFPTISMQEKDKIMQKLGIHVILSLITVLLSSMGIWYFLNNMTKGPLKKDILYCLFGIFVFSYILYIFVGFIKTFFGIVRKIKKFIFPKVKEASGIVNVIESITTAILSITTLGASIFGLITLVKQLIDVVIK